MSPLSGTWHENQFISFFCFFFICFPCCWGYCLPSPSPSCVLHPSCYKHKYTHGWAFSAPSNTMTWLWQLVRDGGVWWRRQEVQVPLPACRFLSFRFGLTQVLFSSPFFIFTPFRENAGFHWTLHVFLLHFRLSCSWTHTQVILICFCLLF